MRFGVNIRALGSSGGSIRHHQYHAAAAATHQCSFAARQ